MRILGIDPGIAATGWGVIEAERNKFKLIEYGCIETPANETPGRRLLTIYNAVFEIIDKLGPENAGIEDIFFARNKLSAIPVAQAKGVILLALESRNLVVQVYSPILIKQALTGNGRAAKTQVQEMVKLLLGLKYIIKPDHASDALAAAICCYNNISFGV